MPRAHAFEEGTDEREHRRDKQRSAGFCRIAFERFDTDISIGRTLDEAIDFAMALGPAGEIIRLAGEAGEARRGEVIAALRETFADHLRADGVRMPSSSWFVTARNGAR